MHLQFTSTTYSSGTRIVNRRKRKWVLALRTIKASLTERGIPRYGAMGHVLGCYGPLLPQLLVAAKDIYKYFLIHEKSSKTVKISFSFLGTPSGESWSKTLGPYCNRTRYSCTQDINLSQHISTT